MILDLHVHTVLSGDAKPTVGQYAERAVELRKKYYLDGFVIAEHRLWSEDKNEEFARLSKKCGIVILQAIELDTDFGHILIYGMNRKFAESFNFDKRVKGLDAVRIAYETGAYPVAAHPFRPMLGAGMALSALDKIKTIEVLNGGSYPQENEQAEGWRDRYGLFGTGASDAHYIDELGKHVTVFENKIGSNKDLVRALAGGRYHPSSLKHINK